MASFHPHNSAATPPSNSQHHPKTTPKTTCTASRRGINNVANTPKRTSSNNNKETDNNNHNPTTNKPHCSKLQCTPSRHIVEFQHIAIWDELLPHQNSVTTLSHTAFSVWAPIILFPGPGMASCQTVIKLFELLLDARLEAWVLIILQSAMVNFNLFT